MNYNKIETRNGDVLLDLTEDTVYEGSVLKGVTFHKKDGTQGVGTLELNQSDYNQRLAEMLMTKNTTDFSGSSTLLNMSGFRLVSGSMLGSLASYSFGGFINVTHMIFTDFFMANPYAFVGNTSLKILDLTAYETMPGIILTPRSLDKCMNLESLIVRGNNVEQVNIANTFTGETETGTGSNDTFYVYVAAAVYDTVISNLNTNSAVPASRFRKLEDYPEINYWNNKHIIKFYDGDELLQSLSVYHTQTPNPNTPKKDGYKFMGWSTEIVPALEDAIYYAVWEKVISFAVDSWDTIKEIANSGKAQEYFNIGDTRQETINNKEVTLEIIGFNQDIKADGTGTAGLTIWCKNSLATAKREQANNYPWTSGKMHTEVEEPLFDTLPIELQNIIEPVTKKCTSSSSYGGSTTSGSARIWSLSAKELGYSGYSDGVTYEKFSDNTSKRAGSNYKYESIKATASYWLRSPHSSSAPGYIHTSGYLWYNNTVLGTQAICPCFCI